MISGWLKTYKKGRQKQTHGRPLKRQKIIQMAWNIFAEYGTRAFFMFESHHIHKKIDRLVTLIADPSQCYPKTRQNQQIRDSPLYIAVPFKP